MILNSKRNTRFILLISLISIFLIGGVFSSYSLADVTFKADKPMEFSMLCSDSPSYPTSEDWLFWKALTEKTNVTLKNVLVPMSDYTQKRSLLIAAGDEPEIMPKTYPGQEVPFVASGEILPVSDYVSKMPNFSNRVKEWKMEPDLKSIVQQDGKYYVLPGLHEKPNVEYSLAIRQDILEKEKLAVPKTWDEFYVVAKALKKKYPESIPFSDSRWGDGNGITLNFAAPAFGTIWGAKMIQLFTFDFKADKFIFAPTSPEYKAMVKYFAKLCKEGLFDKESITQTTEMANNKFQTGKSFVINANFQDIIIYSNAMKTTLGEGKFKVLKMPPLGGPRGMIVKGLRTENGIMISVKALKNPNFESMLKFIDWLWYSNEGKSFCIWGVEGVTYKVVNGKKQLMDDYFFQSVNAGKGTKDLRKTTGFGMNGVFVYGGSTEIKTTWSSEADKAYYTALEKYEVEPFAPLALKNEAETEQYNLKASPLNDFARAETFKFIIGTSNVDLNWSKFVKACNDKGAIQLTDNENKYYKRANKK
jgi:putative aldouronate transport system substrate-binding protein